MVYALTILGCVVFVLVVRWAQKKIGRSEVVFKDANGNVESRTESDNLKD